MKTLFSTAILLFSLNCLADSHKYTKGQHYTDIQPAHETGYDNKVVVYEFFSYSCGHCANFEPHMNGLEKTLPEYAKIIRIPLGLQSSWKALAQAYYTAEQLGILDQSHQAIFDALHKERKRLTTVEELAEWFHSEFAVDKKEFISIANSFSVMNKLKKGNTIAQKMLGIPRTPTLVIDGKYKPETKKLGSFEAVIDLTKHLVVAEAKHKKLIE